MGLVQPWPSCKTLYPAMSKRGCNGSTVHGSRQSWAVAQDRTIVFDQVCQPCMIKGQRSVSACKLHMEGLRNWCDFAKVFFGNADAGFPPTVDAIVCWSHTFRCVGTFSNYLGYLRSACMALDVEAPPSDLPVLRRAKSAIVKRMLWSPRLDSPLLIRAERVVLHLALALCRPKMFLQREVV